MRLHAIIATILFAVPMAGAFACSCKNLPPEEMWRWRVADATAIAVLRVEVVTPQHAMASVQAPLKGRAGDLESLPLTISMCDQQFQEGHTYLVFRYGDVIGSAACGGTGEIFGDPALDDRVSIVRRMLRTGADPLPPASSQDDEATR